MHFGVKADKAMNGQEAVEMVKQRIEENMRSSCICNQETPRLPYRVIFMDCNMPVMDGFQATIEIRKMLSTINIDKKACLIAAVTAYTTDNFKQKCFDSGMNLYFTKPVCAIQIKNVLKSLKMIKN